MDLKDGDLRYGIVGAGMMGREHLLNIAAHPGARVTAVADPHDPSRRDASSLAASLNSTLQVFSTLRHRGDIKPNMTQAQILLDVLKHPKAHHVLVEKPLCTTIADCQKVMAASKARPEVLVQVGLEYRYMPS